MELDKYNGLMATTTKVNLNMERDMVKVNV